MKKYLLFLLSLILVLSSIPVYAANESKVTQEMYEDYLYHKQIIDKYIQEGRILPPTEQEYADISYIKPGEKMPRFLAYDDVTGQNIPNPNYLQVGDAFEYWDRQNITVDEMYKNKEMMRRLGVSNSNIHKRYWRSIEGGELQDRIIKAFLKLPIGQEYKAAIETGKQATGKEYRTIEEWLEHYGLFGNATSQGIDLYYTITIGRTSSWYKTYMIPSEWLIREITLLKAPGPKESPKLEKKLSKHILRNNTDTVVLVDGKNIIYNIEIETRDGGVFDVAEIHGQARPIPVSEVLEEAGLTEVFYKQEFYLVLTNYVNEKHKELNRLLLDTKYLSFTPTKHKDSCNFVFLEEYWDYVPKDNSIYPLLILRESMVGADPNVKYESGTLANPGRRVYFNSWNAPEEWGLNSYNIYWERPLNFSKRLIEN